MGGFEPVDARQSFPELEERVLARWRQSDVFARSLANREGAEIWSFYEGPPTANGRPGSHHVLARVFKDVYPRYRTMCGYRVPRKAGWDCHGLPVELEVEKQLGISSKQEVEEFGIAEFNARCRESVFEYVEEWNRLTERIGFWIDLDDPYVTLEDDYIESVWWSLRRLWDADRLYEGHKVVPYCPRCGTALSSHEVAQGYKDVEDPSIYVKLPIRGAKAPLQAGDQLLIWTTTPWTLPGNVAVAAAPDVTYVRAEVRRRRSCPRRGPGRARTQRERRSPRPLPWHRPDRRDVRGAGLRAVRPGAGRGVSGHPRRLRNDRGRDRAGPHSAGIRGGRLRRRDRKRPLQTGRRSAGPL